MEVLPGGTLTSESSAGTMALSSDASAWTRMLRRADNARCRRRTGAHGACSVLVCTGDNGWSAASCASPACMFVMDTPANAMIVGLQGCITLYKLQHDAQPNSPMSRLR